MFDGNGSLVGRGATDAGGIDGIDGPANVSTVRMLEKLENPDRVLKRYQQRQSQEALVQATQCLP